jgi:hypothetical protein
VSLVMAGGASANAPTTNVPPLQDIPLRPVVAPDEEEIADVSLATVIVPLGGFGKKLDDMYEWHWAKDTEAMRGNGWRDDGGRFYVRWCFANLITAQDFARKFGGSIVKGR